MCNNCDWIAQVPAFGAVGGRGWVVAVVDSSRLLGFGVPPEISDFPPYFV